MADNILEAVYLTASDDVLLVRKFPPDRNSRALSFFGGLPRLPKGLDWPYSDLLGKHITFLAQIDLGSLPTFQWRSRLPEEGTLFFFVNTDLGEYQPEKETWARVLFSEKSCLDDDERQAPSDLMPIYGASNGHYVRWLTHDDLDSPSAPRQLPHWPVDAIILRTFATEHPNAGDGSPMRRPFKEAARAEQRRALMERFGDPVGAVSIGHYWANSDGTKSPLGPLPPAGYPLSPRVWGEAWLPDAEWPYSWIFAEIFCVELLKGIDKYLQHPETIEATARTWRQEAQSAGLFSPLPQAARERFRRWIQTLPLETQGKAIPKGWHVPSSIQHRWVQQSVICGVDACLGYAGDYDRLIPRHLLALVEHRHRTFSGDEKSYRFLAHQLLGAPKSIQSAPLDYGATHVLLAQFCHDEGALWFWGDAGVMQFWITPQDLKARRFDRVVMTLEGG
jgi:uncharacterized protein YwqG